MGYEAWGTSYGTRVRVRGSSSSVRGMGAGLGTSHSKENEPGAEKIGKSVGPSDKRRDGQRK